MTFSFRCVTILSKARKNIWSGITSAPRKKNSCIQPLQLWPFKNIPSFPEGTRVRCHKPYREVPRCPRSRNMPKISFGYPTSAERCICALWTTVSNLSFWVSTIHVQFPECTVFLVSKSSGFVTSKKPSHSRWSWQLHNDNNGQPWRICSV